MYTGYKEVQQGDKVVFLLQGAFGGEVEAASGQLHPSSGTDNGNQVLEYSGSHPAAAHPITTQNKEELVQWLQDIIDASNKTMQQKPVSPIGQQNGGTATAAPLKQQNQNDVQMEEKEEDGGDSDETISDSESDSEDEEQKQEINKNQQNSDATATAKATTFHFVSYRQEYRGLSEAGHPPRRMWHWLLKDAQGREHVAVDTLRWEQGKKRFTYASVPPFNQVKPMECHNKRSVIEYMNQFVPPAARLAVHSDTMREPAVKKYTGTATKKAPKSPSSTGKKSAAAVVASSPQNGKGKKSAVAIKQQQQQQQREPPGTFITNTARRNEIRNQHVATVSKQLALLRAECGIQYTLTLVGSDGSMDVVTSKESLATGGGAQPQSVPAWLDPELFGNGALLPSATTPATAKKRQQELPGEDTAAATVPLNNKSKKQKYDALDGAAHNVGDLVINSESQPGDLDGAAVAVPTKRSRHSIPEDPDVAALFQSMKDNDKIYLQGKWIRDPLPPHPLQETLETFQVAEDCGEESDLKSLLDKLIVDLPNVAAAGPGATSDPPRESDILVVVDSLPEPVSSSEVELQPVWGIDSYTRCLLLDALKCCPQIPDDVARDHFIDSHLLPALNGLGDDGWDIQKALNKIENKSTAGDEIRSSAGRVYKAFEGLEEFFNDGVPTKPEARKHVRAHPKGEGVVVTSAGGLPAETFLGEYVGELYTSWRWAEREVRRRLSGGSTGEGNTTGGGGSIAARKAATRMGASSEYYNILLERPKTDPRGYDVLYVDAVQKGNFVSRLSHSCSPNCRSVTVVVNGRLTVGVWTTRDVAVGEELTVDFAGETDSEREGVASVCLCGSAACRGTFLYVTPGVNSPLNAVVASKLTLPDRCGMILEAAANANLSEEESERLGKHGFKELMLHDAVQVNEHGGTTKGHPRGEHVPAWLMKWLALALKFVETEAVELQTILSTTPSPSGAGSGRGSLAFTEEEAADEIDHLVSGRIHSLAVALDKAKMFLRHQDDELKVTAPLCLLSDSEIAEYLWSGGTSVARRALGALSFYAKQKASIRSAVGRRGSARRGDRKPRWEVAVKTEDIEEKEDTQQEDDDTGMDDTPAPSSLNEKHANGVGVEDGTEEVDGAATEISQLISKIEDMLEDIEAETADAARIALRRVAAVLLQAGPCHLAMHDILQMYAGTRNFMSFTQYTAFAPTLANGNEGFRYKQAFLWGLLTNWHRSTDPVDTLIADRRGCVLLPDVESCYMPSFSDGKYAAPGGDRSILLRTIWENPRAGWPKNCTANFTFRHNQKVFGSPQLDVAIRDDGEVACRGLVENLQAVAK